MSNTFLQLTMKLAASEAFKGKKTCYEESVPEPFMYSRLGKMHFLA